MRESVSERIVARLEEMPASERKAAQALIANYPLLGLKTVAEFSSDAGVSSPTILRLVARLGFQNYPEFQAALKEELAAQIQSPLSRSERLSRSRQGSNSLSVFLRSVTENLEETFAHIPDSQVEAITALIGDRKRSVYLIGGRFTDGIARYAAAHLRIIRSRVVHLAGQEGNWRDHLIDMAKADILIVFDIRRYQKSLARTAQAAAERGAIVILFTDQWLSPIARSARHVVAAHTEVPSPWDSCAALFVFVEALLGRLTGISAPESVKRIRRMEAMSRSASGADDDDGET
jgi:DNA-binding MurR/RpiR family transcriptional regulator